MLGSERNQNIERLIQLRVSIEASGSSIGCQPFPFKCRDSIGGEFCISGTPCRLRPECKATRRLQHSVLFVFLPCTVLRQVLDCRRFIRKKNCENRDVLEIYSFYGQPASTYSKSHIPEGSLKASLASVEQTRWYPSQINNNS